MYTSIMAHSGRRLTGESALGLTTRGMLHLVSLRRLAGVETHFAEFVRYASRTCSTWRHVWLDPARGLHPALREMLEGSLASVCEAKFSGRVKLPPYPRSIRSAHCRRFARRTGSQIAVVWNRAARSHFVLDALGAENVIHWEHGRAWHDDHERDQRRYFRRVPEAIANSNAAKRVLELLWDFRGQIHVCRNALRPSLMPASPIAKSYPVSRAIRLGVAARLDPVKGVPVALHALQHLRNRSLNVELHIAGDGNERTRLEALARRLGVGRATRFRGALSNMAEFYAEIDCLLHAPLTAAFGLVAIEAAAHGCPVIAARIDGLGEAVQDGVSGFCLQPALPMSLDLSLGDTDKDVPRYVYDPSKDALQSAQVVDPSQMALAVERLFASPEAFERMSLSASRRVVQRFRFADHVAQVMRVVTEFAARERP
jgi:glycosyltransferase involved in cell wall biosynthesis